MTAWKNDPLQHYVVSGPNVYAMTGDRRTAVLMDKRLGLHFCAESLPDAVAVFSAASKANASLGQRASAAIEDVTAAGLLQTFQRTEIAELYRQMGWNLCLAWAQGAITDAQYYGLLDKYLNGGLAAIKKRASQTQVMQTTPSGSIIIGTANPPSNPPNPPANPAGSTANPPNPGTTPPNTDDHTNTDGASGS